MQAEYCQRRDRLMSKIGNGTAIFRSAPVAVMHNDVEYAFRQDSDFFYFTGFNESEAVAVFAPHHPEHRFILFVQPKNWRKEVWSGWRIGVDGAKELLGADAVYPIAELDKKLPQYLEKADRIYYRMGRDGDFNNTILEQWQRQLQKYAKRGTGPTAIEDSRFVTYPLRLIKSDTELALMRQAIAISVEAHNRARTIARPGIYEYEIQAEMEYIFRQKGAMGPAYPSIIASGPNACILHYVENNRQLQDGDLLLIDAGCCYNYYNADITRTFPVNGKFTAEQRTIYEIVLEAQKQALSQVKPGNTYQQMHEAALRVILEGLMDLGLLIGDIEQVLQQAREEKPKDEEEEEKETKIYKPFYMHGTGHWLGLDVHDTGIYKQGEENWLTFQPNQVITVEPGIYIGPETKPLEGQPEINQKWRGIGIRIEDDVLLTSSGNEVLTKAVPKTREALEI